MNIYFAGSIRGGREDKDLYLKLINHLKKHGTVLTEHIGRPDLTRMGDKGISTIITCSRAMLRLQKADVVIAEVTNPSLGVGYELAKAEEMGLKILCLYRPSPKKSLSALVAGNRKLKVLKYSNIKQTFKEIDEFLNP